MTGRAKYCYWSVAGHERRASMQACVRSAREAGVYKTFHVLTDAPIPGCECYDAQSLAPETAALSTFIYLKAAISKLNYDYFVWLDPATVFAGNPLNLLGAMGRSPLHVPLETNLLELNEDSEICGVPCRIYCQSMRKLGARNPIYCNDTAFWMIARDAIDTVSDLISTAWREAPSPVLRNEPAFLLGYAMQILCGDPEKHLLRNRMDLWAQDRLGNFDVAQAGPTATWEYAFRFTNERRHISPAMIHKINALTRFKSQAAL